jgi:hypothetical protein
MIMTMKMITCTRTAPQASQIDYDAEIIEPAKQHGKGFGVHVLLLAAALPLFLQADTVWTPDKTFASECTAMSSESCTAYMVKQHGSHYTAQDRRELTAQIRMINVTLAAR